MNRHERVVVPSITVLRQIQRDRLKSYSCKVGRAIVVGSRERHEKNSKAESSKALGISPAITAQRIAKSQPVRPADILTLQELIGNRAVHGLLARRTGHFGDANRVTAGADYAVDRAALSDPETVKRVSRKSIGNSTTQLQRDAKADDVPQQSVLLVDEFAFPNTIGTIVFDAPSSPGSYPAPIVKDLSSNRNVQVTVPPASTGTVMIKSQYLWRGHLTQSWLPVPHFGIGEAEAIARFRVSPEGKFEFTDGRPQISQRGEGGQHFTSNADGQLNLGGNGSFGSIVLNLALVSNTSQTSTGSHTKTASEGRETSGEANLDVGVEGIKIGGYKAGHKDSTGNSDANTASNAITTNATTNAARGWAITLNVPPPAVGPTLTTDVLFSTNSSVPKADQKSKLQTWFLKLPQEVSDGLKSGKYKISFLGQASHTGDSDYNIRLTARRNQMVAKLLKEIEPGAKISEDDFKNAGFLLSNNPPKIESAEDKAVHIKIEPNSH